MKPYIKAAKAYTEKPDLDLFQKHTHEYYEIFCFLSGDARYFVEGTVYNLKPDDILIIKKSETHTLLIRSPLPYSRFVINFNTDALSEMQRSAFLSLLNKKPLGKMNRISSNETEKSRWKHYMETIVNADSIDTKQMYLAVLLNELCENLGKNNDENSCETIEEDLIEYINQNLMTLSSLDKICKHFFISKTHLNRKFKKVTGSSVWDYIVVKRLIVAKDLLMKGAKPNEVYQRCGYSEYSSFYRAYKAQFGVSPKSDYCK